ncbi:hypothetical protein LINPERHAP1_LOCUS25899 [Linum perenne]
MFIVRQTTRQTIWLILDTTLPEDLTRCIILIVIWPILFVMTLWELPNPG